MLVCLCFCMSLGNYRVTQISFSWIGKTKSVSLCVFFISDTLLFCVGLVFFLPSFFEKRSHTDKSRSGYCAVWLVNAGKMLFDHGTENDAIHLKLCFWQQSSCIKLKGKTKQQQHQQQKKRKNACVGAVCGCALVSVQDLYLAKDDSIIAAL